MRADRLLSIMLSLQREGRITAETLATRFEVSERTISRDVEALSIADVPIYTQTGTNGGIFLDEHYRTSLTGLSIAELRTLFVNADAGPLADLGLASAVEGTILKLFASLPGIHQQEVNRLRQRFYIDSANWFDYNEKPPLLADLQQAVWEDCLIVVDYRNYEGTISEQTLAAYALVAKANAWYLIAQTVKNEYRTYRAARLVSLRVTKTHFERDSTFDLVRYWQEMSRNFEQTREATFPFYPVVLRLTVNAFDTLRDHISKRYEKLADLDADGWLTVRVLFLSLYEARMNVFGLGAEVQVVGSLALEQAVLETAKAIVAAYDEILATRHQSNVLLTTRKTRRWVAYFLSSSKL